MTTTTTPTAFLETHRATVAADDCDDLGHMNVQRYFGVVSDGMFTVMARVGLTRAEIDRRQLSFAVVRAEGDFHREVRAGDVVALESSLAQIDDVSATFHHRLRHLASGSLVMTARFTVVIFDLTRRQAVAFPADVRQAIAALFAAG